MVMYPYRENSIDIHITMAKVNKNHDNKAFLKDTSIYLTYSYCTSLACTDINCDQKITPVRNIPNYKIHRPNHNSCGYNGCTYSKILLKIFKIITAP